MKKILISIGIIVAITAIVFSGYYYFNYVRMSYIQISSVSHKTEYFIGEKLDTNGLLIEAFSNKKSLGYINIDECEITGFDNTNVGNETICIKYKKFSVSYDITIKDYPEGNVYCKSITINTLPNKTTYKVGENIDLTGATLKLNYSDGTYFVIPIMPLMIRGFSSEKVGDIEVKVYYNSFITTFTVKVVE